jgi:hypothetical protein
LFSQLNGNVLSQNLIGFIYLGYLLSFGFCIYSIIQFKRKLKSTLEKDDGPAA